MSAAHHYFDGRLFGEVFVTLTVIIDPLGNMPVFLALTSGRTDKSRLAWQWRSDGPSEIRDVNVALVPLGTPLLAGPGAIVATIVFVQLIVNSIRAFVENGSAH